MPFFENPVGVLSNGPVLNHMRSAREDFVNLRRTFLDDRDEPCVLLYNLEGRDVAKTVIEKGERVRMPRKFRIRDLMAANARLPISPVTLYNATSTRRQDWIYMDSTVVQSYRNRLSAWADLRNAGGTINIDGYANFTLEYEAMSDPGSAQVDMFGTQFSGQLDSPRFIIRSLPLPITFSDYQYGDRQLAVAENHGTPLLSFSAEAAGRRIGETIEGTLIGTITGMTFGTRASGYLAHDLNSTVFGYLNYTNRNTKTNMTTPSSSNGSTQLSEWLTFRNQMYSDNCYGPFVVYTSTDYDNILSLPYSSTEPSAGSIREFLLRSLNGSVTDIRRLDNLTNTYTTIWVQQGGVGKSAARAVVGMEPRTMQWDLEGGMIKHYRVMTIQSALLMSDYGGQCGIGVTSTA